MGGKAITRWKVTMEAENGGNKLEIYAHARSKAAAERNAKKMGEQPQYFGAERFSVVKSEQIKNGEQHGID